MPGPALDVTGELARLQAEDSGRPRLTWYGPGGERVELSARVLANWVAKTANLLRDEADVRAGSRVVLALPAHWRAVVWLLGIWSTGGCAVLGAAGGGPDVWVGDAPAGDEAPLVVGVALPALAASFGPGLPAGAVDGASEVRSQPDVFVPAGPPSPADPALELDGAVLDYAGVLATAAGAVPPGTRLLTAAGPELAVKRWLAPLLAGGSLVLHGGGDVERIAAQEAVTLVL